MCFHWSCRGEDQKMKLYSNLWGFLNLMRKFFLFVHFIFLQRNQVWLKNSFHVKDQQRQAITYILLKWNKIERYGTKSLGNFILNMYFFFLFVAYLYRKITLIKEQFPHFHDKQSPYYSSFLFRKTNAWDYATARLHRDRY